MIDRNRVVLAADEILAAAVLAGDWTDGLQQLADATEAGGATLTRVRRGRPTAALSSAGWIEAENALIAAAAPLSPRQVFPRHVHRYGFVGDTDIWADHELRRDPYFQEFQRPRGVFYRAKARLLDGPDQRLSLVLRRLSRFGPYEPADIASLDSVLPKLHMAVRIARRMLDAETAGMVGVLHRRGNPLFELDAFGRALQTHGGDEPERLGVCVRGRRLCCSGQGFQAALDRAVAAAVGPLQRPALIAVANRRGERRFLRVVPVTGHARDVFFTAAALVVVIEPGRGAASPPPELIREALGLTEREVQIAVMLAEGFGLATIAQRLHIGLGTVRNHLKTVFEKTGTRRQGELVALLCALRP